MNFEKLWQKVFQGEIVSIYDREELARAKLVAEAFWNIAQEEKREQHPEWNLVCSMVEVKREITESLPLTQRMKRWGLKQGVI